MRRSPAFQFYAAEYLADEHVQLMTLDQEGAYIRLLAFCWREGSIPKDLAALSSLCKGASTTLLTVVAKRFKQDPGNGERLIHTRLEAERLKQQEWREKSAKGGRKSGKARGRKAKESKQPGPELKGGSTIGQAAPLNPSSASFPSFASVSASENEKKKENSAFAGLMNFLSRKIGPIPNPGKEGKAISWLIDNGYDAAQCEDCYEFLAAQPWRTSAVTWTTVKAEIGGWLSKGQAGRNGHHSGGAKVSAIEAGFAGEL